MSVVFLNLEYASEIGLIAKWLEIEHHLKIMLSHHSNHCNQLKKFTTISSRRPCLPADQFLHFFW